MASAVRSLRAAALNPAAVADRSTEFVAGSDADFDRLYRTTYSRLFSVVLGLLRDEPAAEDCVQETFVRAYRGWRQWRGDAPAEAWLHQIAMNVARSYQRWNRLRQVGELLRRLGLPKTTEATPNGLHTELVDALRRLPAEQAAVVLLRHHYGYSNREIARALAVPESTIASRLAKAKEKLRGDLERRS